MAPVHTVHARMMRPVPALPPVDRAVLRTLAYADVFDYPLTAGETHHYLISQTCGPADVAQALACLGARGMVETRGGWFHLPGRADVCEARRSRAAASSRLWIAARRWGLRAAALPFVRMVAVTGALSMDNAADGDDIDLFVVSVPGRVWLTRLMAVSLVRLARAAGVGVCPNYVLAEDALAQTQRDLYVAHEIAQMRPLAGGPQYAAFHRANAWWRAYLPNARAADGPPDTSGRRLQGAGERALRGRLGNALEAREHVRKRARLVRRAPASPAARLDASAVKGHFNDHGARVLREYERRLARIDALEPQTAP